MQLEIVQRVERWDRILVFCYYFLHEEAESMGCWDEHQQPARTIETIRKELSMTTAPSGA